MAANSLTPPAPADTPNPAVTPEGNPPDAPATNAGDFMNNPDIITFIQKSVAEGIQQALKGTPPRANITDPSTQEKSEFEKMGYKERLQLFQSNPHAYNKLAKGVN